MASRPEVLIEKWFPIETIGAESMRERGASSALPPLYFLHVWWARRPLLVSRAAILASVLPVWSEDWPKPLREQFPSEESYRAWFLRLCGILGDPVRGRKLLAWARSRGEMIPNPYSHARAFTVNPGPEEIHTLRDLLELTWGTQDLAVLDPFAGGGSIPFESLRYGFRTYANELNPVATVILKATLDYPFRFGPSLVDDIRKYGEELAARVREKMRPYFADLGGGGIVGAAYLWARTVRCPYTGKPIPLSPNWWLVKGAEPIALHPIFESDANAARFEIVTGKRATSRLKPDLGTVKRGNGVSPWANGQTVDGDYIKAEAQAGRIGQQLIAVALKREGGFEFRSPDAADSACVKAAEDEYFARHNAWLSQGALPTEPFWNQGNDLRPLHYGMEYWYKFFSPRQALSLATYVQELKEEAVRIRAEMPRERADAVVTYLGLALDKAADYNSRMVRWHSGRSVIVNTFDRHDYSFKWSHAEFDAAHNLFPWVIGQVVDAYAGIAKLVASETGLFKKAEKRKGVTILRGDAKEYGSIGSRSIHNICVDPPYYDNVMYAELADFFYVWLKLTVGSVHPQFFAESLTNKDDEAVANLARFKDHGKKRHDLAFADYQRKMLAAFREMHRVLTDDGVLTVMFTHKKVEAWDTLATSLIGAGFAIRSSWPVHTESEHSLHQAKKNAAQSTILLTCRKRAARSDAVWWDDIKGKIRVTARETAEQFERQGIRGVDLYIATFGPTLAVLSEHWPVLTSETDERTGKPKELRPEVALDLAREEVVRLRKEGLLLGRTVQFDPITDWYLMAWDAFKAEEFPADEARKLALALGLDLETDVIASARIAAKKSATVVLQEPGLRRRKGTVDPEQRTFGLWIDAAHTAMLVYLEDGPKACEAFLKRSGLRTDGTFIALLQSLINAIPRARRQGEFVRPEAKALDAICMALFPEVEIPVEEEPQVEHLQGKFWGDPEDIDDEADGDNGDEEES